MNTILQTIPPLTRRPNDDLVEFFSVFSALSPTLPIRCDSVNRAVSRLHSATELCSRSDAGRVNIYSKCWQWVGNARDWTSAPGLSNARDRSAQAHISC